MARIIPKILTIVLLPVVTLTNAQEIWRESFAVPGKGVSGDEDGTVYADFTGVGTWTLDYASLVLTGPGDYAKTVSTSGGRFEACDINGEVVWRSEPIDISGYQEVCAGLTAAETGSGANTATKYLKACYSIDGGEERLFGTNGFSAGNWGSVRTSQQGLTGNLLRIVCYLSTHYAADKVILDEVTVFLDQEPAPSIKRGDVVISEIMADPVPQVGLPEAEYLELYNTLDKVVSTQNWKLRINGTAKALPAGNIAPQGYMLLCATGSVDSLAPFGPASGIPGFPGLLNKGAEVELLDANNTLIDRIGYSDGWYRDAAKEQGGWSLERIDPLRYCNPEGNWKASIHANGGTPGSRNSVFAENTDDTPPGVKGAAAVSAHEVEVAFTEPIDTLRLFNTGNYLLEGIGNPDKVTPAGGRQVMLHFNPTLQTDRVYQLGISNLTDDCGNPMADLQCRVQWNTILPGDVLVSEILFDPYPGAEDYIEIYNPSDKLVDLSRLLLASRSGDMVLNQMHRLTPERRILFPREYLALTSDTGSVFSGYPVRCWQCFLQMDRLPSFPNDEGRVVVLSNDTVVADELYYNENMHSPFLAGTEGVSLERVSFTANTNAPGNWHSAAGDAGYGTPGYENSQAGQELKGKPEVTFEPEAFSPNADGYNDVYCIRYRLPKPGYAVSVKIFDAAGRFVQYLVNNETLGTTGTLTWNGEDETGKRQPVGVYVVIVELYNEVGDVHRFKDGVVLTGVFQ